MLTEDGATEDIGLLTLWSRRRDEDTAETTWWGHVIIYRSHDRGGQYRATLPADRIARLIYCGRLPTGQTRHNDDCYAGDRQEVWG